VDREAESRSTRQRTRAFQRRASCASQTEPKRQIPRRTTFVADAFPSWIITLNSIRRLTSRQPIVHRPFTPGLASRRIEGRKRKEGKGQRKRTKVRGKGSENRPESREIGSFPTSFLCPFPLPFPLPSFLFPLPFFLFPLSSFLPIGAGSPAVLANQEKSARERELGRSRIK
jgi:hypothetical protein